MNINYNVTGSERKRLVSIITRMTGDKSTYQGAPTMAYAVGGFTVSRDGDLTWDDTIDNHMVLRLADMLEAEGFQPEEPIDLPEETISYTGEDLTSEEMSEGLTISLPMDGFNPDSLDRLQKLVDSKARLIERIFRAKVTTYIDRDSIIRVNRIKLGRAILQG